MLSRRSDANTKLAALVDPPDWKESTTLRVESLELVPLRVSARTTWLVIVLHTNTDLVGLGEASLGSRTTLPELDSFFALAKGASPLDIEAYRARGRPLAASGGLAAATAFSAIEHALWDLAGKAHGVPVHQLLGGRLRSEIPLYANINRMTTRRDPKGFAISAQTAVAAGFSSLKAAPFDGFPTTGDPNTVADAIDLGIGCLEAMRAAVGTSVAIKVDCHSHFTQAEAIAIAARLEPVAIDWYEEPVPVANVEATRRIRDAIARRGGRMAGGELMFGIEGFTPLLEAGAVDVIMPDVMHCGGIKEAVAIATLARDAGVAVSPHNACGPVSTAVGLHLCALAPSIESLELQWGEVAWRGDAIHPRELIKAGQLRVPDGPGLGIALGDGMRG